MIMTYIYIYVYIYILYVLEDISYFTFTAILSVDSCLIVNHCATHYQLLLTIIAHNDYQLLLTVIAHNDMVEILLITQHYY
jgi:hypothetical protein